MSSRSNAARSSAKSTSSSWPARVSVSDTSSASEGESSRQGTRSGWPPSATLLHPVRQPLVDERPEHAEVLDRLDEAAEVHGLHHVGVHAQVVAGDQVLL